MHRVGVARKFADEEAWHREAPWNISEPAFPKIHSH
jgi:hypothetical protein